MLARWSRDRRVSVPGTGDWSPGCCGVFETGADDRANDCHRLLRRNQQYWIQVRGSRLRWQRHTLARSVQSQVDLLPGFRFFAVECEGNPARVQPLEANLLTRVICSHRGHLRDFDCRRQAESDARGGRRADFTVFRARRRYETREQKRGSAGTSAASWSGAADSGSAL